MNTYTAPAAGTTVKPVTRDHCPGHWAHKLRGTVVESNDTDALVKWDYPALGGEPLAAYWMTFSEFEIA